MRDIYFGDVEAGNLLTARKLWTTTCLCKSMMCQCWTFSSVGKDGKHHVPQNDEGTALDDDESAKVDGVPVLNLFIYHNES